MNKIICWNCRGAGSKNTNLHLRDLLQTHKSKLVALMETRVGSNVGKKWLNKFDLNYLTAVEANYFAGGIWLL